MDDEQLLRYSRQILLPEFDLEGQERLLAGRVLVIGIGGLGSPVSMYLGAAGVGHLTLVDPDTVELSNLQRQVVHATPDLGRPKVESAADRVHALNPEVRVQTIQGRLEGDALRQAAMEADVVVDASDNFETRFAVNAACVATGTPLVSGAAVRFEGQVSVFRLDRDGSPCYRCLYNESTAPNERCTQAGVVAPLLGIVGSVQAMETMKLLAGIGDTLTGRMLLLDALSMDWRVMRFRRDPKCPVCSPVPATTP